MTIEKVISTNAVLVNRDQKQLVLMGQNIGYQKRPGDPVDEALIERIFEKSDEEIADLFD